MAIGLQFGTVVLEGERPVAFVLKALQQRVFDIALERYTVESIGLVYVVVDVVKQLRIGDG